jgi:hypothetical protein
LTTSFFLVVGTIVSINGIGLNLSVTAFAQQQPQANFTSAEQQLPIDGNSFEIDNVTFTTNMVHKPLALLSMLCWQ